VRGARSLGLTAAIAVGLSGCSSTPRHTAPPPARVAPSTAPAPVTGAPPETVPDAIPRYEPRSLYGNPPFYDVFGKRYFVMSSSFGYVERGVASWYGPGFHKVRTSMGEIYDMYGMTAAHKTLPLPAYVRVTNLENGRSCVVRVNDRGPFVGNRIIDLSYTAAAKLDMLRNGTAMVEVRVLQPQDPAGNTHLTTAALLPQTVAVGAGAAPSAAATASPPPSALIETPLTPPSAPPAAPPPAPAAAQAAAPAAPGGPAPGAAAAAPVAPLASPASAPPGAPGSSSPPPAQAAAPPRIALAPVTSAPVRTLYVQAGAFADPANAERLAEKLRGGGYGRVFVRDDVIAGRKLYRVRIGPVPDVPEFDRIVAALEQAGVRDAHLALD
jgi:rare lipoprotein A (peptidoglycan hydrolase)